jgi:hypothetical protein
MSRQAINPIGDAARSEVVAEMREKTLRNCSYFAFVAVSHSLSDPEPGTDSY